MIYMYYVCMRMLEWLVQGGTEGFVMMMMVIMCFMAMMSLINSCASMFGVSYYICSRFVHFVIQCCHVFLFLCVFYVWFMCL